jgi:hypothetical protein
VKYLAFLGPGSGIGGDVDSLTILKACQGVESLHIWSTIWVHFRERGNFQNFITSPSITLSPRRLFIRDVLSNRRDLSHFGHAIFRNLTHLEVDMFSKWEWDTLRELNCLTHLSLEVDSDMDSRTVSRMVTQFPNSLKIIIFWAPEYLFGVRHAPGSEGEILDGDEAVEVMKSIQDGQTDQRGVLGDRAGNLKARSERDPQWNLDRILAWESSNASRFDASRKDYWTLAEELVERRRLDLATCERFYAWNFFTLRNAQSLRMTLNSSLRKLKHEQNSCPSHKPLLVHEGPDAPWQHLDDLGRYEDPLR